MAQSAQVERTGQVVAQWEHLTVVIKWDTEREQWRSDWSGGRPHRTLDGILDQAGAQGWELVSVVPYIAVSFDHPVHADLNLRYWAPTQYQAIFKRRKRG